MKHTSFCRAAACLALLCLLAGCGGKTGPEAVARGFLTHCFTADEGGRYTAFATAAPADDTDLENMSDTYYAALEDEATPELIEKMKTNTTLVTLDRARAEAGQRVEVTAVSLKNTDKENTWAYTVTLKVTGGGETTETHHGTIRCAGQGEAARVDYFWQKD